MNRQILRSHRVLCPEGIRPADVVLSHDLIEEVAPYGSVTRGALMDLGRQIGRAHV